MLANKNSKLLANAFLFLIISSFLLIAGALGCQIGFKLYGLTSSQTIQTTCSISYLNTRLSNSNIIQLIAFIAAIVSLVCLFGMAVSAIVMYVKTRPSSIAQQNQNTQLLNQEQSIKNDPLTISYCSLIIGYIVLSLAIIADIVLFGLMLNLFISYLTCKGVITVSFVVISCLSFLGLIFMIICWILWLRIKDRVHAKLADAQQPEAILPSQPNLEQIKKFHERDYQTQLQTMRPFKQVEAAPKVAEKPLELKKPEPVQINQPAPSIVKAETQPVSISDHLAAQNKPLQQIQTPVQSSSQVPTSTSKIKKLNFYSSNVSSLAIFVPNQPKSKQIIIQQPLKSQTPIPQTVTMSSINAQKERKKVLTTVLTQQLTLVSNNSKNQNNDKKTEITELFDDKNNNKNISQIKNSFNHLSDSSLTPNNFNESLPQLRNHAQIKPQKSYEKEGKNNSQSHIHIHYGNSSAELNQTKAPPVINNGYYGQAPGYLRRQQIGYPLAYVPPEPFPQYYNPYAYPYHQASHLKKYPHPYQIEQNIYRKDSRNSRISRNSKLKSKKKLKQSLLRDEQEEDYYSNEFESQSQQLPSSDQQKPRSYHRIQSERNYKTSKVNDKSKQSKSKNKNKKSYKQIQRDVSEKSHKVVFSKKQDMSLDKQKKQNKQKTQQIKVINNDNKDKADNIKNVNNSQQNINNNKQAQVPNPNSMNNSQLPNQTNAQPVQYVQIPYQQFLFPLLAQTMHQNQILSQLNLQQPNPELKNNPNAQVQNNKYNLASLNKSNNQQINNKSNDSKSIQQKIVNNEQKNKAIVQAKKMQNQRLSVVPQNYASQLSIDQNEIKQKQQDRKQFFEQQNVNNQILRATLTNQLPSAQNLHSLSPLLQTPIKYKQDRTDMHKQGNINNNRKKLTQSRIIATPNLTSDRNELLKDSSLDMTPSILKMSLSRQKLKEEQQKYMNANHNQSINYNSINSNKNSEYSSRDIYPSGKYQSKNRAISRKDFRDVDPTLMLIKPAKQKQTSSFNNNNYNLNKINNNSYNNNNTKASINNMDSSKMKKQNIMKQTQDINANNPLLRSQSKKKGYLLNYLETNFIK